MRRRFVATLMGVGTAFEIDSAGNRMPELEIEDTTGVVYAAGSPLFGAVPMQMVTVEISSDQLLNLKQTPVEIVLSPGPGNMILYLDTLMQYKFGTVPYNSKPAAAVGCWPSNGTPTGDSLFTKIESDFFTASENMISQPVLDQGFLDVQSAFENSAILFGRTDNVSGEFTGGDGSVVVTLIYMVIALR